MTDLTTGECTRVLRDNFIGHLAFISKGRPYVVPITYYFDPSDNTIISYSAEGHKIEAMRKNNSVSMVVEEIRSMTNWESAMLSGTYEELEGSTAKQQLHLFTKGVKGLLLQKEDKEVEFISEFSSKLYSRGIPIVFRIQILDITGKRREA